MLPAKIKISDLNKEPF